MLSGSLGVAIISFALDKYVFAGAYAVVFLFSLDSLYRKHSFKPETVKKFRKGIIWWAFGLLTIFPLSSLDINFLEANFILMIGIVGVLIIPAYCVGKMTKAAGARTWLYLWLFVMSGIFLIIAAIAEGPSGNYLLVLEATITVFMAIIFVLILGVRSFGRYLKKHQEANHKLSEKHNRRKSRSKR